MMADSQNAWSKIIIIIIIIKSRYIANEATVCSPIKCPKQNTENLFSLVSHAYNYFPMTVLL